MTKTQRHKINVVLDLDQTLISAESSDDYDFKGNMTKAKKFEFHDMDGYYVVFERPGLQEFLDYLFSNFNVSIWTAASKDYALYIIDNIIIQGKSNRKLDWIFFSYHCDISKRKKQAAKSLEMFWDEYKLQGYSKKDTIIVDDHPEVYDTQPDNCVKAEIFEFTHDNSEKDDYLSRLQKVLSNAKCGKPAVSINKQLNSSK